MCTWTFSSLALQTAGTSPWTSQWTCLFHQNPMKAAVPPPKLAWKLEIRLDMAWKSWGFLFKLPGVPLHNDISQWEIEQNEGLGFNMFEWEHHPRYSISMCQYDIIIEHPIIIGTYSNGMFLIETIEGLITAEARETRRQSRLDSLVFEQLGFIHNSFSTDVKSHDFLLPRFRSIVHS